MSPKSPSTPAPYKRAGVQVHNRHGQPGWRLRVHDPRTGRQPEKNFYGTYEAAAAELERWRKEVEIAGQPSRVGGKNMRLGSWAVEWLDQHYRWKVPPEGKNKGIPRRRGTWLNARAMTTAYIAPGLGKTAMGKLTYTDCYKFIAGLRVRDGAEEAAPATKATVASVLRLMLADAHRNGVIPTNPAADLPTSWGYRKKKILVPSLVQVEELASAMDAEWPGRGNIVRMFAYTGMRWEDAAGMRLSAVDMERRSFFVENTRSSRSTVVEEVTKTDSAERYAAIIDQAVEPFEWLTAFAQERDSEWLLTGERGGPLSYSLWRKHLDKARAASGVDYTAHSLRHLCVSLLIAGGASTREVRDQVGHSTTQVTERVYRHAFAMDRRELAKQLSAAFTAVEVDESSEQKS